MSTKVKGPKPWVPHKVAGQSVWEQVDALNAPHLFDGALRVPVLRKGATKFDVTGLMKLSEAREKHPKLTEKALRELHAATERFRVASESVHSPLHRLRLSITLPKLGVKDDANYFYDPVAHKIVVMNWGAAKPPAMYAYEGEEPASSTGASMPPSAAAVEAADEKKKPEGEADVARVAPPTKEEEAQLVAMATDLENDLREAREAMDFLEMMISRA